MRGVSYHHVQCSHQHTVSHDVVITSVATVLIQHNAAQCAGVTGLLSSAQVSLQTLSNTSTPRNIF